jgi:hypothetical protein
MARLLLNRGEQHQPQIARSKNATSAPAPAAESTTAAPGTLVRRYLIDTVTAPAAAMTAAVTATAVHEMPKWPVGPLKIKLLKHSISQWFLTLWSL